VEGEMGEAQRGSAFSPSGASKTQRSRGDETKHQSFAEIHISLFHLHISSGDLYKSRREIYVSAKEIHISSAEIRKWKRKIGNGDFGLLM